MRITLFVTARSRSRLSFKRASSRTSDGIVDSMWCEGNKSSDGTGEWLELGFAGTQSVSGVKIRSGGSQK